MSEYILSTLPGIGLPLSSSWSPRLPALHIPHGQHLGMEEVELVGRKLWLMVGDQKPHIESEVNADPLPYNQDVQGIGRGPNLLEHLERIITKVLQLLCLLGGAKVLHVQKLQVSTFKFRSIPLRTIVLFFHFLSCHFQTCLSFLSDALHPG